MSASKIQWTEHTWNPVRGCTRVSEGCRNCYAERMAARGLPGMNSPKTGEPFAEITPSGPRWTGEVELIESMLDIPLRRRKPTTWFVNSMSDLFHESLPDEAIDRVFAVMALCPQHTFQVLTKRAERMLRYWRNPAEIRERWHAALHDARIFPGDPRRAVLGNPSRAAVAEGLVKGWRSLMLPNVWLGVSCEDQKAADERIPMLLQTPGAVRFVSAEPLLGPIDFTNCQYRFEDCDCSWDVLNGVHEILNSLSVDILTSAALGDDVPRLDQIILGGESGPGSRPCDLAWVRSIVEQCAAADVACFVKQLGARPVRSSPNRPSATVEYLTLKDPKGGDPEEWPADLRVRQMPRPQKEASC